jgi:glycosyltransferase involved in cell wall biosynthesis
LPRVLTERPGVRWLVVGQGADLPVLRARCENLGVGHAVDFAGGVEDESLIKAYRRADVFVLPSRADPEAVPPVGEGFGLVFAEAGAFGVPSIGSSAGGGSLEFVRNEKTGLTVPPNDPEALFGAIVRLMDDAELRARLGQGARELVQSRHLPSQFSAALWDACL